MMDLVAIGGQCTGFFIWPIVEFQNNNFVAWTIPIAVFLTSAGWWENYVTDSSVLLRWMNEIRLRMVWARPAQFPNFQEVTIGAIWDRIDDFNLYKLSLNNI